MSIKDYLSEGMIFLGIKANDKKELISIMVDHLVSSKKLPEKRRDLIIEKFMQRESLASTGIGAEVAIPHAFDENIKDTIIMIGQIPDGVDFDSIDGDPVKVVFVSLGSDKHPKTHLQLLASIVRICKKQDPIKFIINSESTHEVYNKILEYSSEE